MQLASLTTRAILPTFLSLFCASGVLFADPGLDGFDYGEMSGVFEDPGEKDGYLSFGPLDRAHDAYAGWKTGLAENHGFSFMIEDRLISQWGEGASILDNELNLIFRGEILRERPGSLSWNVWGQFADSVGGTTVSEFQQDLGILSPLNGGNGGPETSNDILQMAMLEYVSPDERWRFQVGKLALRTLVNLNRYANGDSEMFFSPMLGNNPVVPYMALLGVGAYAQYRTELFSVSGVMRAPDTELGFSLDSWETGHRGYIVELAFTPDIPRLGEGNYRLTWSLDEETDLLPKMETWSFSADQDFGERIGAFFRYAWADTTFRDFDRRLAAGFQVKKPFGFSHDRLGVGYWLGRPTDDSLADEQGLELYYKAQISPFLEITPDIQFIRDPAFSDADRETVFGLRLRVKL